MTAAIAVITVAHNSSATMERWLSSWDDHPRRSSLELCVVDSGSNPEERERLASLSGGRVDVLEHQPNLGFGRAGNVGAAVTSAPILLFANPDAYLEDIADELLDPERVTGTIFGAMDAEVGVPHAFSHMPTARLEAASLLLGERAVTFDRSADAPAYVSGGSLLIARADFEALGGFSPSFFMFFEDADLCQRHRVRGGDVRVSDGFRVRHVGVKGSGGLWHAEALDGIARLSARVFAARWGRRWQPAALYLVMLLGYLPRRLLRNLSRRLLRGEVPAQPVTQLVGDLLLPRRIMKRLGAVPPAPP